MTGLLAGALLLATLMAWRGGEARRDVGLLAGSGLTLAAGSAALLLA